MNVKWYKYLQAIQEDHPENFVDRLDAHMMEGKAETVVSSIFYRETIGDIQRMMEIMIEYIKKEEDDERTESS